MKTNTLGETKRSVSDVGLGTWQLGADGGEVSVVRERVRALAPFRNESGPSSARSVSAKGGA